MIEYEGDWDERGQGFGKVTSRARRRRGLPVGTLEKRSYIQKDSTP